MTDPKKKQMYDAGAYDPTGGDGGQDFPGGSFQGFSHGPGGGIDLADLLSQMGGMGGMGGGGGGNPFFSMFAGGMPGMGGMGGRGGRGGPGGQQQFNFRFQ